MPTRSTYTPIYASVISGSPPSIGNQMRLLPMTEKRSEIKWLSIAQRAALRTVEEMASRLEADAYSRLTTDLRGCGCTDEMFEEAMRSIRAHARVVVHFHPDRFGLKPMTVAECSAQGGPLPESIRDGFVERGPIGLSGRRPGPVGEGSLRWCLSSARGGRRRAAQVWSPGTRASSGRSDTAFRFVLLCPSPGRLPALLVYIFRERAGARD